VISDFGYCSIPENEGSPPYRPISDVQVIPRVIPFPRDTCNDDIVIHVDPRRPLYDPCRPHGCYALSSVPTGSNAALITDKESSQNSDWVDCLSLENNVCVHTNKTLPTWARQENVYFTSMYIYMLSRWISIETQRYHIGFWFRGRVFSIADNEGAGLLSIVSDVQIIPFLIHVGVLCMVDKPRSSVPTGSNAALLIADNESSQNKWLGWLLFTRKKFYDRSHEVHPTISCFVLLWNTWALYIGRFQSNGVNTGV
jgi:hypothetical protein